MPFYEYECSSCRFYVEVLQKISEQPLKKCPSCGKNALKKLVSAPVFRLKGSGWYETDFKSDQENKRNLANTEKEGKEPKPAEADAKSDAKADAKVEGTEAKAESKTDGAPAAAKPAPGGTAKTATRSGNKAKSKGAARGKSAGSRGSTSSRSKSSAKRRRGR